MDNPNFEQPTAISYRNLDSKGTWPIWLDSSIPTKYWSLVRVVCHCWRMEICTSVYTVLRTCLTISKYKIDTISYITWIVWLHVNTKKYKQNTISCKKLIANLKLHHVQQASKITNDSQWFHLHHAVTLISQWLQRCFHSQATPVRREVGAPRAASAAKAATPVTPRAVPLCPRRGAEAAVPAT